MTWNTNIQEAPRGRTVTVMRNTKTRNGIERVPVNEFEIDPVWLATKCGKVVRSYWIPETEKNKGRWGGLANGEQPIAWQEYIVPVHPAHQSDAGAFAAVKGKAQLASADSAEPSASDLITHKHIFLDDSGSGA